MARYFLHLRDGSDSMIDEEGQEFADPDALRLSVLEAARDVISGDAKRGLLDLRFRIEAEDENGAVVYTLPFKHAVSIVWEE